MGGAGRKLPNILRCLLSDPAAHAVPARFEPNLSPPTGAVVADSGATDHMFPERCAFVSYQPESSLRVKMGNNTYIPVRGRGSAVIELNGRLVLVRDALHVPDLRLPLYSLRAHLNQPGCCFLGLPATSKATRSMHVCFPSFALQVDMSRDCYLAYRPVGDTVEPADLAYRHPSPSQVSALLAQSSPASAPGPTLLPADDTDDSVITTGLSTPRARDPGPADRDGGTELIPIDDEASAIISGSPPDNVGDQPPAAQDGGTTLDATSPSVADVPSNELPAVPEMARQWFCPESTKLDPKSRQSKLSQDSAAPSRPVLTPSDLDDTKSQVKSMTRLLSSLSDSELIEKFHMDTYHAR